MTSLRRGLACIDQSTRMATILNTAWPDPAFDPEAITVLAAAFDEASHLGNHFQRLI